ncbi:MAG: hypothetical protein QXT73_01175 [Candidatus Methanomethylicaceae archaeon]
MKLFLDFHHSGAARSLVMTLSYRLGHEVYFPAEDMVKKYGSSGVWLLAHPSWFFNIGGIPEDRPAWSCWRNVVTEEEFLSTDWDAVIFSRVESQEIFRELLRRHPRGRSVKVIAMTGNDATRYDWSFAKNFLSSDFISFEMAPRYVHKMLFWQEIGLQYWTTPYEHLVIRSDSLRNVGSFVNCWPSFNMEWCYLNDPLYSFGVCPNCCGSFVDARVSPVNPYGVWKDAERGLSVEGFRFLSYGIGCKDGMIQEKDLLEKYRNVSCVVHLKTYEGYGHSLLQAVFLGRIAIVPKRFFRYRTASRFLIPFRTCIEIDWDSRALMEAIRMLTRDIDEANLRGRECCRLARSLVDWDYEAAVVGKFLEELR